MREKTGVGKYERGSSDASRSAARVWVPCTFRPFAPEIDKILPVFRWTTEVHESAAQIRWKRESSMRIFLGPNWYSSGEGEKLGIVCWPEDLIDRSRQLNWIGTPPGYETTVPVQHLIRIQIGCFPA